MSERVVNLTVHGIGTPVRELEPGEDQAWSTVEQFESVLDAVAGRSDVRLTFDDANSSDVEIALPRLLERGLTAEFFLLAGRLGEPGRLDCDGVRELLAAGMTIGSHGWAHRDWRGLDEPARVQEIERAPEALAEIVGLPVRRIAVPFGSYDRRVLGWLRAAGADRVYTSDGGRSGSDSWLQARTSIGPQTCPEWTAQVLDGTPALAQRARRTAARMVKRWRGAAMVVGVAAVGDAARHVPELVAWPA